MHKLIFLLLTLLACASIGSAQMGDNWVRLAPPDGGFAIMVPGQAEEKTEKKGEIFTSKIYMVIVKEGGTGRAIYLAGFGEYAPSIKLDPLTELNANRDNFMKELSGMKLVESQNITLDGRLGIEFTGESNQATVTCRFYIKGNRVFQLAALVFKGIDEKKNVGKFFDSFAFTN